MKIELYPKYEEVFLDEALKGIFYPLCKVSHLSEEIPSPLFFISTNGMWMDETKKTEFNSTGFTIFDIVGGKYKFRGNLELYQDHNLFPEIYPSLEDDFENNGSLFLNQRTKTEKYMEHIKSKLDIDFKGLDIEYYLQAFYEYSMNKLNYEKTGIFGAFNEVIHGWHKSEPSPIVYLIENGNSSGYADIETNKEEFLPSSIRLEKCKKVGYVVGHEFFADGNDTYLVYDTDTKRAICINHYS